MKLPSNKILILGAISFSIVASVGAYKIGEARRIALENQKNEGGFYVDIEKTNEESDFLRRTLQNLDFDQVLGSSSEANPFAPAQSDTLTDAFAKNIFLSYAGIESGSDSRTDDEVANDVISQIDTSTLPKNPFTLANINIYSPRTTDEIRGYGNAVGSIIKENYTTIYNRKNSISLSEIAQVHKKIGNEIIAIPVPNAISTDHLQLANSYVLLGDSFEIIAEQEKKDPLRSLLAVRTAQDAGGRLEDSYKVINSYFAKNGILFNNDEPGVVWSRIVLK